MKPVYVEKTTRELSHFIFAINDGGNGENKELEFKEIDSIGAKAFQDVSNVKQVFFDEHLQKIGKEAFKNCEDLEVFCCGEKAEEETKQVKGIKIANLETENFIIESLSFSKCKNLHTVIFQNCKELIIEKDAFSGCSSLRTLVYLSEKIDFTGNPFEDCPENLTFVGKKENSALERFARENGYRYVDVEGN